MITELCLTDFLNVILKVGKLTDLDLLKALFLQVLNAVTATHEAGLCHLDIKLENLLVAKDYSLRLCDYGFSRTTEKNL